MAGFDYGNARLRAMKSRLLSRREMEALAEAGSLKGLIAALTKTAYRQPVESALTRATGIECVAEAIRQDLANTIGKIGSFYTQETAEIVAIVLRRYDIHNLKTILRGLSRNAPPGEILNATLPAGELTYSSLAELARAPDERIAIDLLASMNSRYALPLLRLRLEHPGVDHTRMELALDQWNFQEAQDYLEDASLQDSLLSLALKREADLANLLTVLRFVATPGERKTLPDWLGTDDLTRAFVGPGQVPFQTLAQAGMQDTLDAAVGAFAGTDYEPALKAGLQAFSRSSRLSDIEKELYRFRLGWMSQLIQKDPLGVGALLGYLTLKENEIRNLRWIALGLGLGMNASAIQAELEFAP